MSDLLADILHREANAARLVGLTGRTLTSDPNDYATEREALAGVVGQADEALLWHDEGRCDIPNADGIRAALSALRAVKEAENDHRA